MALVDLSKSTPPGLSTEERYIEAHYNAVYDARRARDQQRYRPRVEAIQALEPEPVEESHNIRAALGGASSTGSTGEASGEGNEPGTSPESLEDDVYIPPVTGQKATAKPKSKLQRMQRKLDTLKPDAW